MIDLDNHFPGEGSAINFADALENCRQSWRDGVAEIQMICPASQPASVAAFEENLARLRAMIAAATPDEDETENAATLPFNELKLHGGYEWMMNAGLPAQLHAFPVAPTLNESCSLLIRFPSLQIIPEAENILQQLIAQGYKPILAQPECSRILRGNRVLLERMIDAGARVQLDAASLLSGYGREVERFALQLLEQNQAQFVVTRTGSRAGRRVSLSEAIQRAARLIGRPAALALVTENPQLVLTERNAAPAMIAARDYRVFEAALSQG